MKNFLIDQRDNCSSESMYLKLYYIPTNRFLQCYLRTHNMLFHLLLLQYQMIFLRLEKQLY